jgi:hypothetical protein
MSRSSYLAPLEINPRLSLIVFNVSGPTNFLRLFIVLERCHDFAASIVGAPHPGTCHSAIWRTLKRLHVSARPSLFSMFQVFHCPCLHV